jgi:hypothetical protein
MSTSTSIPTSDLTQRPPRSPRVRLGGYVILARALDKGRAKIADKLGEYHYACPLDKRFLDFVKVDPDALYEQLKIGKGDWEILEWIKENAGYKPVLWEITQWSAFQESRTPESVESKERVAKEVARINKERTDILTGFDLLDLDDYVTFGGKP